MTDKLRANPARDLAFQESIKEGHLWECESFYAGWDAAMALAKEAVRLEREAIAAMFDDSPNAEMFRQDIADQIRSRSKEGS